MRHEAGHRFAHLVGDLLETMGYRTRVSPAGPDKGIDIVAFRDELGLHPPIIKVQVKSGDGNLHLLDGDALLDLLVEHYEELDARYRTEIPLKRVYIPEPAEEVGGVGVVSGLKERALALILNAAPRLRR